MANRCQWRPMELEGVWLWLTACSGDKWYRWWLIEVANGGCCYSFVIEGGCLSMVGDGLSQWSSIVVDCGLRSMEANADQKWSWWLADYGIG